MYKIKPWIRMDFLDPRLKGEGVFQVSPEEYTGELEHILDCISTITRLSLLIKLLQHVSVQTDSMRPAINH